MKKWGVLIVVSLAVFIIAIDTTMMSVAITRLAQDLNTEVQNIQMAIATQEQIDNMINKYYPKPVEVEDNEEK